MCTRADCFKLLQHSPDGATTMLIHVDSLTGFIGLYGLYSQTDTGQTIGVLAVTSSHTGLLHFIHVFHLLD